MKCTYHIKIAPGAYALAHLMGFKDEHLITEVWVPAAYRGNGYGNRLMEKVTEAADEEGATLTLDPCPYGRPGVDPDRHDLVEWYGRHGFAYAGSHDIMIRYPE